MLLVLQGQIYKLNPKQSDKIEKVLDILSGNFVAASLSQTDKKICVVTHLCHSRVTVSH